MAKIAVVYFSGYGHTAKMAEAIGQGASAAEGAQTTILAIDKEGNLPDGAWETLAAADAILFGSPTYMGGPAWQFKKFADASSKPWFQLVWKDKVAGGFTNSASINGDKFNTITYFITLAMQHGMVWVGTGLLSANKKASQRNDVNWIAGYSGALAQSPADASPDEAPPPGDLETARIYGKRVAEYAVKTRG
ncbi:MAG TPA: flavodoxin family protein [Acetobacteraceae bacterium]|nr:flavodoxin family protein [Acetobacteraceae bacterium]